jgi:hypothetical protein
MVDRLHILIWNRTKKFLVIALNGMERESTGRNSGGHVINVQYKPIWNCHNEFPLYNEYVLLKNLKRDKQ